MKITAVEVFDLDVEGTAIPWHPVVVRIHTDEGISGVGEAGLAYGSGHSGAAGMLVNLAEEFLLGKDPTETESIWNTLQTHTFWGYSPGPVIYGAISAIDIALWDIKGKALGLPVYKLLGGPCRERIRTYASQVQFGWSPDKEVWLHRPEDYARVTRIMVDEGFTCVKVNPLRFGPNGEFLPQIGGKLPASTVSAMADRVRAVREEGGPDLDILIEFNSRCATEAAVQLGQRLEEFDIMYLEEPVHFMDMSLMRDMKARVNIPLAGGERLYTRWQFLPYLQERIISLAQPDIGLAGGFTEVKKICDLAHIFDVQTQMHVCGGPVGVAASLHMAAAVVNYTLHEHHVRLRHPGTRAIVKEDYQPHNGCFELPEGPGLGIELNDEVVNRSPRKCVKLNNA
ncbi:mandelate racemase/muconate lactonizing enzyme family protein [Nitratidesulfovibrio sp.]|uniref:mandelate racemase/muconate lactonizing enzyme family protein n=1 Tax=Nitratidesulfovibrio sp. TaxID=2802297 RepID=UPI00334087BE